MKKILVLALSASILGAEPMVAQTPQTGNAPSASKELYNFKKHDALKMIKYFKDLNDQGKKFPTVADFQKEFGVNVELLRSHVRKAKVLGWKNGDPLGYGRREGRTVFMNLPTGKGSKLGGFPSGQFDNDPYTLWQYTDLFGAWNHSFFQAPGSWATTAHKHGVDMMSGITFFDTTGNPGGVGSESYTTEVLKKDATGKFLYVKPLIHILMYLGLDGINYNWEASGWDKPDVVAFHRELRDYAKELGFDNYRQAIYMSKSSLDEHYAKAWLWNEAKSYHTGDIMLNYFGNDFATHTTANSADLAKNLTGSYDHLYQGAWIVTMKRSFAQMEGKKTNLCLWGEHEVSRFVSNNTGVNGVEKMSNLQQLFERAFSGGSRNAGVKDDWGDSDWGDKLSKFGGISRMIPERSTLEQSLPFCTFFNTGAGERYFYKGKSASMGGWYDMAAQDLQPTYRWLQYNKGTKTATPTTQKVQVEYTYEDAYTGGSSLRFKGDKQVDIILYSSAITVGADSPKAKLAFKAVDEEKKANGLVLLLHKQGAGDTEYVEVNFADLQGKTWEEQEKTISELKQGDVIDLIGIRMTKETDVYLGELAIFDNATTSVKPATPKNLKMEVKEETVKSLAGMLSWEVEALAGKTPTRKDNGLIYNDEAGVHHFEIFYKDGESGQIREIARTESWSTYVPKISFTDIKENSTTEPYIGVRAVAQDLKTSSPVQWLKVERQESVDLPKEDIYCKSELDPAAAGANVARQIRYLDKVSTTGAKVDLNYISDNPDTDGDNYVYHEGSGFTVEQGSTINFTFRAHGRNIEVGSPTRDGLQWCWAATYIDWNNNGVFEADTDERIQELNLGTARKATPAFQTTGVTKSFTVPSDATPGTVRVRVVFTDAWFPTPTPCGKTAKGFTFDFDMKIEGNHPGRPSTDKHDEGKPEEPENVVNAGTTPVLVLEGNTDLPKFYPNPAISVVTFENTDIAWIYNLQGQMVMVVKGQTANIASLPAGTYVVKAERNNVTRSYKLIKK